MSQYFQNDEKDNQTNEEVTKSKRCLHVKKFHLRYQKPNFIKHNNKN